MASRDWNGNTGDAEFLAQFDADSGTFDDDITDGFLALQGCSA